MTVGELIEELKRCDSKAEVVIEHRSYSDAGDFSVHEDAVTAVYGARGQVLLSDEEPDR